MKLVIVTCPRNEHLVPQCIAYWQRAWPDCPWPIETVSGTGAWADVMLKWLTGQTEPFAMLLEDYVTMTVDVSLMELAEQAIERERVGRVALVVMPRMPAPWADVKIESSGVEVTVP